MLTLTSLSRIDCNCFLAVLRHLIRAGKNYPTSNYITRGAIPSELRPIVNHAISSLVTKDFLIYKENLGWSVPSYLADDVYDSVQSGFELPPLPSEPVPASDRFVTINHNSPDYADADASLAVLVEEVRGNNSLFADSEQRLAVLSEVQNIRSALKASTIRTAVASAITATCSTLTRFTTDFFNGTIRAAATKVLEYVIKHVWPGPG